MTCNSGLNKTKSALMLAALLGATLGAILPSGAMAASWGAISADEVIGEKDPFWGAGGGDTKDEAEKNAQNSLARAGATKEIATTAALKECNNANCSIVTADCN